MRPFRDKKRALFLSLVSALMTLLMTLICFFPAQPAGAQASLDSDLEPFLTRYEIPGLAAAVVKGGKILAAGAVGTRKAGAKIPVTIDDRFHLGSDTKAMTALLAAMLVEEGRLRWESTLAEVFPELSEKMVTGLRRVTIVQFMSHTSGIPRDNETFGKLLFESLHQEGNLDELRYWLVGQWITQPLASEPGTTFAYANMNYVIIGAVIERVSGKPWDALIRERIFSPLGLKTAGLGCQATLGQIDAPLAHSVIDGKVKAFLAGPNGDNPTILGPAGIAHMSILDFARWAGWNAGEGKRGPDLVRPETMRKLHAPVVSMPEQKNAPPGTPSHGRYALGWGELTVDWAPKPLLYHGGSNGKNLAHIWLDLKNDIAMVVVTNIGGQKAKEALFAIAPILYTRYGGGK